MTKSKSMIYKYLVTACFACALCFLFPYTGDDWAWGSAVGLRRLAVWFDNYNGRYIGNLIVLVLTRSRLLRAIAMSLTYTGIIYSIERIVQKSWSFIIALLGILLLPRQMFRQVIVWTSGFANYTVSAFLTLIFFVYLNEQKPNENYSLSYKKGVFLLILGICNTLIVEHLTFFHVILSVSLFIYSVHTNKLIKMDYLVYMIGCIAGAGYMFSNTIFRTMVTNPNTYYHVAGGGIINQALKNYFGMIYHEGYYNNHFINIIMFIACFLLYRKYKQSKPETKMLTVATASIIIMAICLVCSLAAFALYGYSYIDYDHLIKVGFEGCLSFISLFATIVLTLQTTYEERINKKLVLLWFSFIAMIAPLFEVSPIGPRCFFAPYMILVLIVCEVVKNISLDSNNCKKKTRRLAEVISGVMIVAYTGFYFRTFFKVYQAEKQWEQIIYEKVSQDQKTITLKQLPYGDWLWGAVLTDENDVSEYRFKMFYQIPEDVDVIFTDTDH